MKNFSPAAAEAIVAVTETLYRGIAHKLGRYASDSVRDEMWGEAIREMGAGTGIAVRVGGVGLGLGAAAGSLLGTVAPGAGLFLGNARKWLPSLQADVVKEKIGFADSRRSGYTRYPCEFYVNIFKGLFEVLSQTSRREPDKATYAYDATWIKPGESDEEISVMHSIGEFTVANMGGYEQSSCSEKSSVRTHSVGDFARDPLQFYNVGSLISAAIATVPPTAG